MNVKIDTKERFHVINIQEDVLTANMSADLGQILTDISSKHVKNVIMDLSGVKHVDPLLATEIARMQLKAYENGHSFVLCGMTKELENDFQQEGLLEILNATPTESEAWDIVQMEEMEREFLKED